MSEPTQTNCLWIIQLQETKVIVFKIVDILFDENANCDEEYLKVIHVWHVVSSVAQKLYGRHRECHNKEAMEGFLGI